MTQGAAGMKKSGQPSAKASDAAERSPQVYFANLKADMFLQKQLNVIKRAENNVVHRISIDQKILFRRFQAKLRRSKLARAQLYGDKVAERELRARDLHVLNTNCGQEQDDFDFLKKLEKRPCIVEDEEEKRKVERMEEGLPEVTDEEMEEYIKAVMEGRAPPLTDVNLRKLQTISELMEKAKMVPPTPPTTSRSSQSARVPGRVKKQVTVNIRPVTTAGTRNEDTQEQQHKTHTETHGKAATRRPATSSGDRKRNSSGGGGSRGGGGKITPRTPSRSRSKSPYNAKPWDDTKSYKPGGHRARPMTSPSTSSSSPRRQKGHPKDHHSLRPDGDHRPRPVSSTPSPRLRRRSHSREKQQTGQGGLKPGTRFSMPGAPLGLDSHRSSVSVSRRTSATPGANMFEEEEKVDVVALRLAEARSNDISPKVTAFLKTLLDLEKKERLRQARRAKLVEIEKQIQALGEKPDKDDPHVLYLLSLKGRNLEDVVEEDEVEEIEQQDKTSSTTKAVKDEKKGDRKWDYYATKMALQTATVKKDLLPVIPGTPEDVKMRSVGNCSIPSITMPRVNLNFSEDVEVREMGASGRWAYETKLSREAKANVFVVQYEMDNRV